MAKAKKVKKKTKIVQNKTKVKKIKLIAKPKKASQKVKPAKGKKHGGPAIAYLALGSNVGDREEYIEQAGFLLEKNPNIQVIKRSTNFETEAEGGGEQPNYMNAAIAIRTKLSPHKLLEVCQEIETVLGREREMEWGPRTMDIDILMYNNEIISDEKLQIPHPLMHERMFVLKPLREIAASLFHPVLEKTIESIYEERKAEGGDKYDDELPGFKEIRTGGYDDYERW